MLHYLPLSSTTDHVLTIVRAHAGHHVERLVGFTLVARTIDSDGKLRSIVINPDDQDSTVTDDLLEDGRQLSAG